MKILIRVDGGPLLGMGHVHRCMALARSFESQVEAYFLIDEASKKSIELIKKFGFKVIVLNNRRFPLSTAILGNPSSVTSFESEDANLCIQEIERLRPNWVISDHYYLLSQWRDSVKSRCPKLLVIDDLVNGVIDCDLLLNQNLGVTESDYAGIATSSCNLLLGTKYALLRPEFSNLRQFSFDCRSERVYKKLKKRLLISFGAGEVGGMSLSLIRLLSQRGQLDNYSVTVVLGPNTAKFEETKHEIFSLSNAVKVLGSVENMAELMVHSDLAIGLAGSSSWERCCLGLPSVLMVASDDQHLVASGLQRFGAAEIVSHFESLPDAIANISNRKLMDMSLSARNLVDGQGAVRVASSMEAHSSEN